MGLPPLALAGLRAARFYTRRALNLTNSHEN